LYTDIYTNHTPGLLEELALTPAMQRLDDISMHCGCDRAGFAIYRNAAVPYSRLTHSIGVAKIVWNFTRDIKQAVAGLFHDIATPVFAHSIDFLNGDYMEQESTEDDTAAFILGSEEIMRILAKHKIKVEEVSDYHLYPIADNETPMLSADRLEYTLGDGYFLHHLSIKQISDMYQDLVIVKNEIGMDELCFSSLEQARRFMKLCLRNSYLFVSDEDRFSMQYMADLVRYALEEGVIGMADLGTTESAVIAKIEQNPGTLERWRQYGRISAVLYGGEQRMDRYCVNIAAKKRYINPLVCTKSGCARISEIDKEISGQIRDFLDLDLDKWIYAG